MYKFTILQSETPSNKSYEVNFADNKIQKIPSFVRAVQKAFTVSFNTISEFAAILSNLTPNQTIMLEYISDSNGVMPSEFYVLSKSKMEAVVPNYNASVLYSHPSYDLPIITRSPAAFTPSDILCLDKDLCIGYETLADNQLIDILSTLVYKDFESLNSVTTSSNSARVMPVFGSGINPLPTGSNSHTFILTQPKTGTNRGHHDFLKNIHQRLILAGYYHKDSDKSLIDPSVGSRCRVFYEGAPNIAQGFENSLVVVSKQVTVRAGKVLDTGGLADLNADQVNQVRTLKSYPQHGLTQYRGEYYYDVINELTMFEVEIGREMITMPWGDPRIQNMKDDEKLRCQVPNEIRTESRSMNGLIRKDTTGEPFIYDNGSGFHYKGSASSAEFMFRNAPLSPPAPLLDFLGTPEPAPAPLLDFLGTPAPAPLLDFLGTPAPAPLLDFLGTPAPVPVLDFLGTPEPVPVLDFLGTPEPAPLLDFLGTPEPAPLLDFLGTLEPVVKMAPPPISTAPKKISKWDRQSQDHFNDMNEALKNVVSAPAEFINGINQAILIDIWDRVVYQNNKYVSIDSNSSLKCTVDSKFVDCIVTATNKSSIINRSKILGDDETIASLEKKVNAVVSKALRTRKQVEVITNEVDVHTRSNKSKFKVERNTAKYHLPFEDFVHIDDFDPDTQQHLIDDYLNHFPQFAEILKFITAVRFAKEKRRGTLVIQAPSSWGKTFFTDAILGADGLNILYETDFKALQETHEKGTASGIDLPSLSKSWVILQEEATNIPAFFKKIDSYIKVTPKYGNESRYPINTKLFISAEPIAEVQRGSINEQLAERANYIEIEGCKMTDREVYNNDTNGYRMAVISYAKMIIMDEVMLYRAMDERAARLNSLNNVNKFYKVHRIGITLKDQLTQEVYPMMDNMVKVLKKVAYSKDVSRSQLIFPEGLGFKRNVLEELVSHCTVKVHNEGHILFLAKPSHFVNMWLLNSGDTSSVGKSLSKSRTKACNYLRGIEGLEFDKKVEGDSGLIIHLDHNPYISNL